MIWLLQPIYKGDALTENTRSWKDDFTEGLKLQKLI